MKNTKRNRRNFIKLSGLTGASLVGADLISLASGKDANPESDNIEQSKRHNQKVNMSGYAAPRIETVGIGFIGLGRGLTHVSTTSLLEGVEIKGLCDLLPDKISRAKKRLEGSGFNPQIYTGNEDAWKEMCNRDDIDLIYIATPWDLHAPMAVYAMEHNKHVAIEVPAALTIDECWQLVETSEKTRKHCMMVENTCYSEFELLTLNLARQGFFGDIVHCEGAYIHPLMDLIFNKNVWDMWRLKASIGEIGNLYPTHGLGPVCQVLDINRGDKMDFMVSVSGKDFQKNQRAKELAEKDEVYRQYVDKPYNGNMNTSIIRTAKGRTIMLQYDITSSNVYSRIHRISGTKAAALGWPRPARISVGHKWLTTEEFESVKKKYEPPIIKKLGEISKEVGGHDGADFLMNWRLIDCLRNGLPLDQDCYDAASWSSIVPLSKQSVASRSGSVEIPDFTNGAWKENHPVDLSLGQGGTTMLRN
ncbi:MAG: alpha-N-acetylgalactosaminidase [Cyclobacteriaceae bacterium]|nr:MAG: alpha-N-acetylgalactosaminidase [Cyclobacteriaceae bacterium]